ncbi:MAG: hypothetical protein NZ561_06755, partial [Phycisphaerae bacterium]|nr:hypothetical protein [Phycisphaerae bacterium]MDW8261686.1 hypothetical protein [Phycisphaerales bacterium]
FRLSDREIPSTVVGEAVAERLRRLDQVAYVRFASVYKHFKTLEELVEEAKAVLDAKRFEDPTQGRLFLEPTRANSANGPRTDEPESKTRKRPPRRQPQESQID